MADFAHCEDASALQDYWAFRSEVGLSLQDAVHGTVQLGPTARLLCDSLPVQRLRGLSQLGATRWAFPTAEHSRFGHCAGTAHLAVAAARHLAGTGLRVTPGQVELLEAAALCHDVGHGPFSHTFESCFLPAVRGNHCWHHEDMSARLLEYAVDQQALDISKEQLHLMHAIISGSSSSSSNGNSSNGCAGISGHWGDSDSSWLLQIVANATNGVDVDKVDYLRRDALMTGMGAAYDFTPLLSNCRVIEGELCFHSSQQPALAGLFAARAAMHSSVYQHRSARAAELMVVDALLAADPVLHISKHVDDPEAFLTLDDSLLGEIKRAARRDPQCPHLAAAAAILRRLDTRQLYAWAAEAAVPEQFVLERGAAACSLSAADVIAHQDSSLGVYLSEGDLRLSNMSIDCGKGIHDPLDYTRLYSSNSSSSSSTWLASQGIARPASFMQRKVRVYLARPCQGSDRGRYLRAVQAAFKRAVAARFGSGATICCCADGSSSARLDPWQQQQQQSCVTTQPLAAAAAGFNAQQHMIQGTAGLVSWPPSPQQQKQQQQQRQPLLLQAELADDPMSGSDVEADGEGCSVGQQQQGCSLQDGPVVKVWSEES